MNATFPIAVAPLPAVLMLAAALCAAVDLPAASMAEPKRVLLIHSYGQDFASFGEFATHFRAELAARLAEPHGFP